MDDELSILAHYITPPPPAPAPVRAASDYETKRQTMDRITNFNITLRTAFSRRCLLQSNVGVRKTVATTVSSAAATAGAACGKPSWSLDNCSAQQRLAPASQRLPSYKRRTIRKIAKNRNTASCDTERRNVPDNKRGPTGGSVTFGKSACNTVGNAANEVVEGMHVEFANNNNINSSSRHCPTPRLAQRQNRTHQKRSISRLMMVRSLLPCRRRLPQRAIRSTYWICCRTRRKRITSRPKTVTRVTTSAARFFARTDLERR